MKRILVSLFLAFIVAFMLTACGTVDQAKPVLFELFDDYDYTSFPESTPWSYYTRTAAPDIWITGTPNNWSIGGNQVILDMGAGTTQNSAFINNNYNSGASCTITANMTMSKNNLPPGNLGLILRATGTGSQHYAFIYTVNSLTKTASLDYYPVIFTAENPGVGGNTISLSFNGTTDTIASVVNAWNTANPANTVVYPTNQPNAYIPPAGTFTLTGGLAAAPPAVAAAVIYDTVTFTAATAGAAGNTIKLLFNGTDAVTTVVNAWNLANPANTVGFAGQPGSYKPALGAAPLAGGLDNTAVAASYVHKPVTFAAVTPGAAGNSIALAFTGSNTLKTVVDAWNAVPANSTNQVSFTGLDGYIPIAGTYTLANGCNPGTAVAASVLYDAVIFTAVTAGMPGNSIALVFNGTATVDTVVNAWNTLHPANTVFFTGQPGSYVPKAAGTAILVNGSDVGTVAIQKVDNSGVPSNLTAISTALPAGFDPTSGHTYRFSISGASPATLTGSITGGSSVTATDPGAVYTSGKTGFFLGNAHAGSVSRYFIWEP